MVYFVSVYNFLSRMICSVLNSCAVLWCRTKTGALCLCFVEGSGAVAQHISSQWKGTIAG